MKTTLQIQNLKCVGCANTIINRLSELNCLTEINVDNIYDSVSFNYETTENLKEVKTLLAKLGYPIAGEKNALTTKVKSFVSCAVGRLSK
ncbi:heavy-metal-associated domain-containing protein [Sabulilitoribacter arenilitoris]|uniref:Heavy-metal-associated domain-containing protein n=1 Tax=Wocania arenilitoris TaxID=2044858 RepID=A0AAE3EQV0_9FLAO|nr:heavy-metal-associated domain-containing protein [Wocania arenilitoris]MCF7568499.1 heavy-metal-associated domain-containing protein [Wocania arenilitoris]